MTEPQQAKPLSALDEVCNALLQHIHENGWVAETTLRDVAKQHPRSNGSEILSVQAIRKLVRSKVITQRAGADNALGFETLIEDVRQGGKEYTGYRRPVPFVMVLRSPALGQVSDIGDPLSFRFDRDADGQILFTTPQFHAMLQKAHMAAYLDGPELEAIADAKLAAPSRESVRRWRVVFKGIELPEGVTADNLPQRIRRPVNEQNKAVGELRHEALPPGTRILWEIAWPSSHWHDVQATELLYACQHIGFSPAGNGKYGGNWGVFVQGQAAVAAPSLPVEPQVAAG